MIVQTTDLSIVIVNWKSADYLRLCLFSIEEHMTGVLYDVVVVDNASDDGCEAMLLREFPWVKFLGATENLGFARANNWGYVHTRGRYVLFLNPDTELRDDALERMLMWLDGHARAGAVGARLLNSDGTLQENCVQAFPTICNQILDAQFLRNLFPHSSMWGMNALIAESREPATVDSVSGACYLARRDAFEAAGRWNEEYFMYSDDLELSYRIRRAGYAVMFSQVARWYTTGERVRREEGSAFRMWHGGDRWLTFFGARVVRCIAPPIGACCVCRHCCAWG